MLILARDALPVAGVGTRRFAVRTNSILLTVTMLIAAAIFGAYPLLLAPTMAGETALVLLAALSAPLHWGLMHESIHGKLAESEAWNRRIGRLLGIALCLDWDMMRFGHLLHHRANRHDRDRPEELQPGQSWWRAAGPFFFQLLGGQELAGMIAPLTVVLPLGGTEWVTRRIFAGEANEEMRAAALRAFTDPARRRRIRLDFTAILALMAFAVWCCRALRRALAARQRAALRHGARFRHARPQHRAGAAFALSGAERQFSRRASPGLAAFLAGAAAGIRAQRYRL